MVEKISIKQIHSEALSCEPLIERCSNGELLCVCQCGGTYEPAPENRVYAFHSKDNGKTWSKKESIYPETGMAVYCTEMSVKGEEITVYLTVHSGRFLDWKCVMMKSFDNGYTWKDFGAPPFFPEYTFIRGTIETHDGKIIIPYQYYPMTKDEHDRILYEEKDKFIGNNSRLPYCECGVIISSDKGKTYEKYVACRPEIRDYGWVWAEPTVAELSDGRLVMLIRKDKSGWLWKCESNDGGISWGECVQTDIPNPGNKPRLIALDNNRIALLHTPCKTARYPYELWISDDDLKSWKSKIQLTDFPGAYDYSDGFYEDGHIRFVIEHNRHTILYFDVALK